jgi:shikimate dehydrogenase
LSGSNTDYLGFIDSLKNDGGISPDGKRVLILGAGGAARAVSVGLCRNAVASIAIFDVDFEKAEKLSNDLKKNFKTSINALRSAAEIQEVIKSTDILINSTPIGMFPAEEFSPVDEDVKIHKNLFVYDLVYNPSQTSLVKKAKAHGAKAVTGLGMLVRQGAASFKLFTGHDAPVDIMMKAAQKALQL